MVKEYATWKFNIHRAFMAFLCRTTNSCQTFVGFIFRNCELEPDLHVR